MPARLSPGTPREITAGLAPADREAVLGAGPPPEPRAPVPWALRVVRPATADAHLLAHWMNTAHVARFWDQAWPRERWDAALAAQLDGTFSRPYLVLQDGVPLAYLEIYRAARDLVARHYDAHPADLGVHVAIGEPGAVNRGFGRALLRAVAGGLLAADPACRRVVAEPDVRNEMAVRAFVAAGYELRRECDFGYKRAALVEHARPAAGA